MRIDAAQRSPVGPRVRKDRVAEPGLRAPVEGDAEDRGTLRFARGHPRHHRPRPEESTPYDPTGARGKVLVPRSRVVRRDGARGLCPPPPVVSGPANPRTTADQSCALEGEYPADARPRIVEAG